jgi:hypothetical protein
MKLPNRLLEIEAISVDVEKFPEEMRNALKRHGEQNFLHRIGNLIKRNVEVDLELEPDISVSVSVAGFIVFERTIKRK